ncbi:2926_t:CDS:2, partial [Dentiscutata heterogama]
EASPTKDILPSSACSELSIISQSSASTIETYSNEENYIDILQSNKNKVQRFMLGVSENSSPQQYTDSIISKVSTANGNVTPNETKFQLSNANFTLLYEKFVML